MSIKSTHNYFLPVSLHSRKVKQSPCRRCIQLYSPQNCTKYFSPMQFYSRRKNRTFKNRVTRSETKHWCVEVVTSSKRSLYLITISKKIKPQSTVWFSNIPCPRNRRELLHFVPLPSTQFVLSSKQHLIIIDFITIKITKYLLLFQLNFCQRSIQ